MDKTAPNAKRDWRKYLTPAEIEALRLFEQGILEHHTKASDFARHKDAIRRRCMRRARIKEKRNV